jgi:hypothetical protein
LFQVDFKGALQQSLTHLADEQRLVKKLYTVVVTMFWFC